MRQPKNKTSTSVMIMRICWCQVWRDLPQHSKHYESVLSSCGFISAVSVTLYLSDIINQFQVQTWEGTVFCRWRWEAAGDRQRKRANRERDRRAEDAWWKRARESSTWERGSKRSDNISLFRSVRLDNYTSETCSYAFI